MIENLIDDNIINKLNQILVIHNINLNIDDKNDLINSLVKLSYVSNLLFSVVCNNVYHKDLIKKLQMNILNYTGIKLLKKDIYKILKYIYKNKDKFNIIYNECKKYNNQLVNYKSQKGGFVMNFINEYFEWEENTVMKTKILDIVETFIDFVGILPIIGDFFDFGNFIMALIRQKWVSAIFSFIAMAPIFGSIITIPSKILYRIVMAIIALNKSKDNIDEGDIIDDEINENV